MKSGQAAMEFLLSYGWALLVTIIAISALVYFGVLKPALFLPEHCIFDPGVHCRDYIVKKDSIQFLLSNSYAEPLSAVVINTSTEGCRTFAPLDTWKEGDQLEVKIGCQMTAKKGERFKTDVYLSYVSTTGYTHTMVGKLRAKVQ